MTDGDGYRGFPAADSYAAGPPQGYGPSMSTPVVHTILAINVGVFLLWTMPGVPTAWLTANLLVSWDHLADGRMWVLLTSVFSHNLMIHLLVNVIVLLSFGKPMEILMGSRRFLAFFLGAGVIASIAHATTSAFLLDDPGLSALGASGALAGVLMLFAFSFPKAKVLLFFFIPLPAIFAALAFVAIDLWGLIEQIGGGRLPIGHGAHLGGGLAGIVYYLVRGGALKQRRQRLGLALGER
jgi:membrane associated rhomboid family serine protease